MDNVTGFGLINSLPKVSEGFFFGTGIVVFTAFTLNIKVCARNNHCGSEKEQDKQFFHTFIPFLKRLQRELKNNSLQLMYS